MLFITAHNSTRTLKHTTYRRQPNDEKQALPQYPQHTRHFYDTCTAHADKSSATLATASHERSGRARVR